MSKVTDIKRKQADTREFFDEDGWVAAFVTDTANEDAWSEFAIMRQGNGKVTLTREQAEFVLPHLQRWLTGDRG